jgi:hydroxymethylpyrimidine/phosphomethylpyrimidine kinase
MLPIALTIGGSDPGGGAGIQADLKTFHQFGVYGTSAIVAVTAQNTKEVAAILPLPPDFVARELALLAEDLPPAAVKSGMLATSELVREVAAAIDRYRWTRYVLDPVMVATSGARLLSDLAVRDVRDRLLPLALLVTPNLPEAEILTGRRVTTVSEMEAAGAALVAAGARAALVKGGHLAGGELVDVLVTAGWAIRFPQARIATQSTHGTGCTLSAAITAGLAGAPEPDDGRLREVVATGLDFVHRAIATAPGLGRGHGPLNHWASIAPDD